MLTRFYKTGHIKQDNRQKKVKFQDIAHLEEHVYIAGSVAFLILNCETYCHSVS